MLFLWSTMVLKFSYRAGYSLVAFGNMAGVQDLTEKTNMKKIIDETGKKKKRHWQHVVRL